MIQNISYVDTQPKEGYNLVADIVNTSDVFFYRLHGYKANKTGDTFHFFKEESKNTLYKVQCVGIFRIFEKKEDSLTVERKLVCYIQNEKPGKWDLIRESLDVICERNKWTKKPRQARVST